MKKHRDKVQSLPAKIELPFARKQPNKVEVVLTTMGQQRVSNVTLINTEGANSVVSSVIKRIIDIFGHRNDRDSYFFNVFYELI